MPLILAAIGIAAVGALPFLSASLLAPAGLMPEIGWPDADASLILWAVAGYLFVQGLLTFKKPRVIVEKDTAAAEELESARASLDTYATQLREAKEREEQLAAALEEAGRKLEKERRKAAAADRTNAEVVNLLGLFQAKGRFIDFLMQDITPYPDAQVGSVARFVHQGCRAVLKEHFDVAPVHAGAEGEALTLEAGFDPRLYRLAGKVSDSPPFKGTVVHRGWRSDKVNVPRVTAEGGNTYVIAPAEIEVQGAA